MKTFIIIDDDIYARHGAIKLLEAEKDLRCQGHASNPQDGMALIAEKQPDVVLLDFRLSNNVVGADLIQPIKHASKHTKAIIVTIEKDPYQLCRCLKMGVDGILSKDPPYLLPHAVHSVLQGMMVLPYNLAFDIMTAYYHAPELVYLNQKKFEIFIKNAEGKKPQQIAEEIPTLTAKTISNELTNIKKALNLDSPKELLELGKKYLP